MTSAPQNKPLKWSDIMDEPAMAHGDELYARAQALRDSGTIVCPPQDQIYRALVLTPPEKLKVCIIGQDPYHTPGAANGLAFSVNKGHALQPSLQNIFKELVNDIGCPYPSSGDLTPWAEQGVLLLNTSLTVTAGVADSHRDWNWAKFTKNIFDKALELPQPIVFILWGAKARAFTGNVDWRRYTSKTCLASAHPSPFSANYGFFGSKPFGRSNAFLMQQHIDPVNWQLP